MHDADVPPYSRINARDAVKWRSRFKTKTGALRCPAMNAYWWV